MRRLVIIVPEWLNAETSVIGAKLSNLTRLAEHGTVRRLSPLESVETPEARWLGMAPDKAELRQGPLTVSALGADPPPRSLHFHLSLASLDEDGIVRAPVPHPTEEEARLVIEAARRLDTRSITLVPGLGVDHGLVWEELGDMKTTSVSEAIGDSIRPALPEGDRETTLRRYIDDSVNLLDELELNRRRVDEGLLPFNLLWPWGHGERKSIPNLALLRGEPTTVLSSSIRLAGLTRLAGYRHTERSWLGQGLRTRLESAARRMLSESSTILLVDAIAEMRSEEMLEEAEFLSRQIDEQLLKPIIDRAADEPLRLLLAAPSDERQGLILHFDSKDLREGTLPFDERTLDDAKVPTVDVEDAISTFLSV